jgi:uncharacterized protein (DUF486 family)
LLDVLYLSSPIKLSHLAGIAIILFGIFVMRSN